MISFIPSAALLCHACRRPVRVIPPVSPINAVSFLAIVGILIHRKPEARIPARMGSIRRRVSHTLCAPIFILLTSSIWPNLLASVRCRSTTLLALRRRSYGLASSTVVSALERPRHSPSWRHKNLELKDAPSPVYVSAANRKIEPEYVAISAAYLQCCTGDTTRDGSLYKGHETVIVNTSHNDVVPVT